MVVSCHNFKTIINIICVKMKRYKNQVEIETSSEDVVQSR